ncbi:hypothetical protein POTOM_008107 [Populus tomentosa]|uniref:Late embryogenesis abundant protein LEA-2 subgroup domain-containing protein n=1 Tax=Populus tomentosa TaxID=118781 RepID=A0A8X8ABU4_POPTO|nr:hypothetical protein POTOM_008107 [Populus tomentosa]
MHAKTDSEVTSLAPSSPTRSPRRPVYYVQSPSRDSHDGEKTTTSFHSTPVLSPMGSPPHSHSSVGRHSRESSSTRFSGSLKPGSRKISPNDASRGGQGKGQKQWKECDVIEEEGLLEDEERRKGLPLKMTYRNKGTFFGVRVTSTPLDLSYSEITIASGNIKKFYQSRKSQRPVAISVISNKIPLYGSGAGLSSSTGTTTLPVPLKMNFVVRSRAYVLGKLVKTKFNRKIECDFTFDPKKLNVPISLKDACTYD